MQAAADSALLRPLAWTRIAFAGVFLIRTTPLMSAIDPAIGFDAGPLLGWPQGAGLSAAVFGLVLPAAVIKILCVARTVFALSFLIGYRTLLAGLACGLCAYVVMLQDVFSFTFTQHLLFLGIAVLASTDCAAVLSFRPEEPKSPRTSQILVLALVVSVYFWAAVCKLRRDWMDGRTLGLSRASPTRSARWSSRITGRSTTGSWKTCRCRASPGSTRWRGSTSPTRCCRSAC